MVIFQDDEVLLKSSSEVRPSHLVGVFQGNAVKVLIRSQLQDAVNEAEGLDVVVGVGVVLGDDFEHRAGDVGLAVGSDVWASLAVDDSGHSPEQSRSDPGSKSLDRKSRDSLQLRWKIVLGLQLLVRLYELFPEGNRLSRVFKTGFDDD